MLNMVVMQRTVIKCCRFYSPLDCLETVAGVIQVGTQWFLFSVILVLYMLYFPPHLKYVTLDLDADELGPSERIKTDLKSDTWRLSITLSWIVFIHFASFTFITITLLLSSPSDPSGTVRSLLTNWATFLGLASAVLAALQYAPQILYTYRRKLVGALSIPMMLIQTPGGFIMAISIMIRPGTNWTSWIMFLVAAIMQGVLLVMCLFWKVRQRKLRIDDFGQPLRDSPLPEVPADDGESIEGSEDFMEEDVVSITAEEAEQTPLIANRRRRKRTSRRWRLRQWIKWLLSR